MNTLITNIGQLVTPQGREPLSGPGMSVIAVEERVEVLISGGRNRLDRGWSRKDALLHDQ